jgi:hypothetical protein
MLVETATSSGDQFIPGNSNAVPSNHMTTIDTRMNSNT